METTSARASLIISPAYDPEPPARDPTLELMPRDPTLESVQSSPHSELPVVDDHQPEVIEALQPRCRRRMLSMEEDDDDDQPIVIPIFMPSVTPTIPLPPSPSLERSHLDD